ncbi:5-formyltetrahydrofolate cyclo-ligase [Nonlabens dokdonensis]|jgi:5-formyltetrahydrofolate cyclo-ligase|uniref:5-formyltetrahydrofolate cyclo-ligase n=2 Tax=Nonlabens dokdonensis TaxID=328515 RepID=L7W7W3_NONDD|nr:5-formyltetrahydrofolate cyclo-ligase [Nonlabens dokdonensis]AGC76249.1 5-formyltetrahydrofolate cyclo-ligase [Nonlabens dokdonensis DSW-6]PZX43913.1 5-formyltetrahydrofolate cyclo-ligase [Nonlabens dokdonensis]
MKPKAVLRKEFLQLRSTLTEEEIETFSHQIANHSLKLDIWDKSTYHIFLPIRKKNEVNTEFVLHILQGKDKNIVVSKSNFEDGSMFHYLLTDQTILKENEYGIPEPDEHSIEIKESKIDVVFVPLLAADRLGNRLGYGKGFYDRFLSNCKPDVIKIGLSFFEPTSFIIEHDEHDVKLDFLIHTKGVVSF